MSNSVRLRPSTPPPLDRRRAIKQALIGLAVVLAVLVVLVEVFAVHRGGDSPSDRRGGVQQPQPQNKVPTEFVHPDS